MIKTTINILASKKQMLKELAKEKQISAGALIRRYLRFYLEKHNLQLKSFKTVEYQPDLDCNYDEWNCFHLSFDEDLYEKCQDFRKYFKISVSLLVSKAIDKYFSEEDVEKKINSDNYTKNYFIFAFKEHNFDMFFVMWEMKEEKTIQNVLNVCKKE